MYFKLFIPKDTKSVIKLFMIDIYWMFVFTNVFYDFISFYYFKEQII